MKFQAIGVALLTGASLVAAQAPKYPFGTVLLNGGRVEPVSSQVIESTNENLNFCFAYRYPDNTIYLHHSKGIHTVTEYGCEHVSKDNGKTWECVKGGFTGYDAYLDKKGRKISVNCWNANLLTEHKIVKNVLNSDGRTMSHEYAMVKFPFKTSCHTHRDTLRLKNGTLLQTAYGRKENSSKHYSFVMESKDDGKTWQYLSTALEDTQKKYVEGANESVIVELKNGDLLNYIRTGRDFVQVRSKDGGKTWSAPEKLSNVGVSPAARLLTNGAIVVVTGRPGVFMLVDYTGTGKHYQKVEIYNGASSSYTSVLELEPNKIMILYDESDFGGFRNPGLFSRLVALTLNVVKDDAMKYTEYAHPEAAKYDMFFVPAVNRYPETGRHYTPSCYQKGESKGEAWYEVRVIPERPHPILHLHNHGQAEPQKWANFRASLNAGATQLTAGFELRFAELGLKSPQFSFSATLKNPQGGTLFGWMELATNGVFYMNGGKRLFAPCNIADGFHAFTVKMDAAQDTYSLLVKGQAKPVFTAKMTKSNANSLSLAWGDGAGAVFGSVDLAYVGFSAR